MSESLFTEVTEGDDGYIGGRYPIPNGWATPTELTHILRAKKIVASMAPQQIYTGFIRRPGSGFPYKQHVDGRIIVPIDEGIQWIVSWLQEKAEKEARKASVAIQKAKEAALALNKESEENYTLETETDTTVSETELEIEPENEWSGWDNVGGSTEV